MIEPILNPGERIDGLPSQNIHIIQNPDMFAYSLDAILLAHFADVKGKGRGLTVDLVLVQVLLVYFMHQKLLD